MKKVAVEVKDRVAIVTDVLRNHKGKMLTAHVIKVNGEYRKINGRLGSRYGVTGTGDAHHLTEKGMIPILEVKQIHDAKGKITGNERQWRAVNFNSLLAVQMKGKMMIPDDLPFPVFTV